MRYSGEKEPVGALFALLFFGFVIGVFVGGIACTHFEKWAWENRAIRHGAARYNEKTAAFEWIELEAPSETLKYSEVPDAK